MEKTQQYSQRLFTHWKSLQLYRQKLTAKRKVIRIEEQKLSQKKPNLWMSQLKDHQCFANIRSCEKTSEKMTKKVDWQMGGSH